MSFEVPPEGYDRLMGRYLPSLGPQMADVAGVREGMTVLDVGCGPGGLTRELAGRVGAERVAAIDPSRAFVAACRERVPGADVREGTAEEMPFEDGSFDAVVSSLVIAFMADAAAGCREMARVAKSGGVVAACMWDFRGGGMTMLRTFWQAARSLDPEITGEATRVGGREGEIAELFAAAGMEDVEGGAITATASYEGFDDWWEPFTLGIGPAGGYVAKLDDERRTALREACREHLGKGDAEPFELDARAWYARGRAPSA